MDIYENLYVFIVGLPITTNHNQPRAKPWLLLGYRSAVLRIYLPEHTPPLPLDSSRPTFLFITSSLHHFITPLLPKNAFTIFNCP